MIPPTKSFEERHGSGTITLPAVAVGPDSAGTATGAGVATRVEWALPTIPP